MVHVCTSEVGKGKGEVLEARCRVPGKIKHLLQNFSRNTRSRMERFTLMWRDTGLQGAAMKGPYSHGRSSQILPEERRPERLISMHPQWNEDEGPGMLGFDLAR